ncbi:MAG TPA: hypothetical protein VFQ35_24595 [Polyangiaceae bacterium]|nr:hypothetical protein [Polyangiaceae bacterium]
MRSSVVLPALALLALGCSRPREAAPNPNGRESAPAVVASAPAAVASAPAAVASAPAVVASAPAAVASTPKGAASAAEANRRCITPESVGATPLAELKGNGERERKAIAAGRAELKRVLENPNDFYATVQATDDLVLLELWHQSAFAPENCNDHGNPGGKCRTFGYDPKRDRITSTKFWQ